jgi:hypothetical protein
MSDRRALLRLTGLAALVPFVGSCAFSAVAWSPRQQIIAVRNRRRDDYVDACGAGNAAERDAAAAVYDTIVALEPSTYVIVSTARQPPVERLTTILPSGLDVDWSFPLVDQRATDVPSNAAFWRGSPQPAVERGGQVLVVAPAAGATEVVRLGRSALARVLARWPNPPSKTGAAIVVARDGDAFADLTGTAAGAASAASVRLGAGPLTIVLAPGLTAAGGQVPASVLTHECVHVVADLCAVQAGADGDRAPRWLREGLAEYLSAKSLGLTVGLEAAARVRVKGTARLPTDFPGDEDFTASVPDLAYDLSWLAVRLVADDLGDRGLIAWYRRWSAPAAAAGAAAGSWPGGVDAAALRRAWRSRLTDWRG